MIWIVSFDIGIKNFAFVISSFSDDVDHIRQHNIPLKDRYMKNNECTPEFHSFLNDYIYKNNFEIVHHHNIDISDPNNTTNQLSSQIFLNICQVLDTYSSLWEHVQYFIIEQQMQFKNNNNIKALKIAQHIYSYFLIHYPQKHIQEYCAYYKTRVLGAPLRLKKHERKKWAIVKTHEILQLKNQSQLLDDYKKKDDVSDCVLMAITFYYQLLIDDN